MNPLNYVSLFPKFEVFNMLKVSQSSVADQINDFVRQMPAEEQKILYLKLKRGELLKRARQIQSKVKKNKITTEQVVKRVKQNRKKLHAGR